MEFQAIICCGKGENLVPFSAVRPHGIPKALLPVANKPMVHHVLDWCYTAFSEILVVTDSESCDQVAKYVRDEYMKTKKQKSGLQDTKAMNRNAESQAIQGREKSIFDFGKVKVVVPRKNMKSTGSVLQSLYKNNQITKNFVILPCDFITDLPAEILIEEYRNLHNEDTLAMLVFYENNNFIDDVKKTSSFKKLYTCYSHDDSGDLCLLDNYSQASVLKNKFLNVRTQMCWRYPQVNVSSKLMDSFIFFCSSKLLSVLSDQFSLDSEPTEESFSDYEYEYKTISKIVRDLARRSWQHSTEKEKIQMFILPKECVFARCDNLPVYMECNRFLMNQLHSQNVQKGVYQVAHKFIYPSAAVTHEHDVSDSSIVSSVPATGSVASAGTLVESTMSMKGMPLIGPESILGNNCSIDERTNVKKSLIHNDVIIGKRCKITGCVIFPNAVIQDDVVLENCIVGHNVTVESKCRLLNCNVENTYSVSRGSNIKGETLLTINIGDDEEEDDEDEDDEEDYDYEDEDDSEANAFEFEDDLEGDFFDH